VLYAHLKEIVKKIVNSVGQMKVIPKTPYFGHVFVLAQWLIFTLIVLKIGSRQNNRLRKVFISHLHFGRLLNAKYARLLIHSNSKAMG
jgi:hypothetical protein